jgi:hypothetical protein
MYLSASVAGTSAVRFRRYAQRAAVLLDNAEALVVKADRLGLRGGTEVGWRGQYDKGQVQALLHLR